MGDMTTCKTCGQYHAAQFWREEEFADLAAELAEVKKERDRLLDACKEYKAQNDAHETVIAELERRLLKLNRALLTKESS